MVPDGARPTSMRSTPPAASTVARSILKYQADDTGSPTNDTTQARNLVEQDKVFAVVGVGTPFFDGASFFARGHPGLRLRGDPGLEQPPRPLRRLRLVSRLHDQPARTRSTWPSSSTPSRWAWWPTASPPVGGRLPVGGHRPARQPASTWGSGPGLRSRGRPHRRRPAMKAAHVDMFVLVHGGVGQPGLRPRPCSQNGLTMEQRLARRLRPGIPEAGPVDHGRRATSEQHVPFEAARRSPASTRPSTPTSSMKKYEPKWTYDEVAFQG